MKFSTLSKTLTSIFLTFICSISIIVAQPYQLEGDFGSGWIIYVLQDRVVTMSATVQSTATNGTAGFIFNNATQSYDPKWCGSNAPDVLRPLDSYLAGAAFYYSTGGWDANLEVAMIDNYFYTFICGKNSNSNNDMSVLETAYNPVSVSLVDVSQIGLVFENDAVVVPVSLSGAKNPAQKVFIRYSTDNWATSDFIEITNFDINNDGSASIPGQTDGTAVSFYVLTTNQSSLVHATVDYFSLNLNNNSGSNYSYNVMASATAIIVSDSALTETGLDLRSLTLVLQSDNFADATLANGNFTLNNVPTGTSIESVTWVSSDSAVIALAFDGTDFDSDSTHFSVTIAGSELTGATDLTSNELTITASMEWVNEGVDNGVIAVEMGAGIVYFSDTTWNSHDLGTYNSTETLILNSGQLFVWKNQTAGGNITACNMYYRIYKDSDTPGPFDTVSLPWFSDNVQGDYNNQLWWNDSPEETNLDLLANVASVGHWNIEVYFEAFNGSLSYLRDNGSSNYIAGFSYELVPALTITADSVLEEMSLDLRNITLVLHDDTFDDATLDAGNFTLNKGPAGTSIESVTWVSSDSAVIALAFDGTDFDTDSAHFSITIAGAELNGATDLNSNELIIKAVTEGTFAGIDYGVIVIDTGAGLVYINDTSWEGNNLGNYSTGETLVLNSGQLFVWKNQANGGNITSCNMYYRLYKDGTTPGAFTQQVLPWQSEWNGGDNQLWWNDSPEETNFNVLAAATSGGLWNIEVYFEAFNDTVPFLLNNNTLNYTAQFNFEGTTSLLIAPDSSLTESTLNNRSLIVSLSGETFADASLVSGNFTLSNLPAGTGIESVNYISPDSALILLSFDGTDFDGFYLTGLTIANTELTGASDMTSNQVLISPSLEAVCPFEFSLGNDTSICGGVSIVLDPGILVSPFGDSLTIFYNATMGQTGLQGANKVYMHAGAELHTGGGWQYVKGNWGMDDNIGLMKEVAPDLWKITINPVNYFGYPADSSLNGILAKFRNADGSLEGADDSGNDIWIQYAAGLSSSFGGVTPYLQNNNYTTISWSNGSTGNTLVINQGGTYTADVNQYNGCHHTDTIIVNLGSLPVVNVSNDTVVCGASSIELSSGGFSSYEWIFFANDSLISSDSVAVLSTSGLYRLNATNDEGCTGFDVFNVDFMQLPEAAFTVDVQQNLIVNFSDLSLFGETYSWDFDGNGSYESYIVGNNSYTYSDEGQYNVSLVVSNICGSDTYTQLVVVTGVGLLNVDKDAMLKFYPNPGKGQFFIDYPATENKVEITIFNNVGQSVFTEIIPGNSLAGKKSVNLKMLGKGIYQIQVASNGTSVSTHKLIIE